MEKGTRYTSERVPLAVFRHYGKNLPRASGRRQAIRLTLTPMRIGLARRGYSAAGGAESYLRRLAGGLEAIGHECLLFAGPDWPRDQWPAAGLRPVVGASSPRAFADRLARQIPAAGCDLLFSLERVWSCDCYRAGDGVHRAWLKRRARAGPAWKSGLRHWNPKHRQILELETALFAGGGAKSVIANSRLVRDEIVEFYGYPVDQIAVVHNGLPAEFFDDMTRRWPERRAVSRAQLGLHESECVILFAGSGWERKGLSQALAAFQILIANATLPKPFMLVAGRGDPKPYLTRMTSQARAKTHFLGPVSDMPACYSAADIFLLPTLYDPFSNACLEALAAGLPVVTTRANGFGEGITPGEHGEIVDEQSPDVAASLANALEMWLDPERRQTSRESCRQKASAYTIADNTARTLDFLHRRGLLKKEGRKTPGVAGEMVLHPPFGGDEQPGQQRDSADNQ